MQPKTELQRNILSSISKPMHFPATQQTDLQKDGWKEFDKNLSIFQGLLSYTLLWLAPIQEACFLPKEIKARINNKHPSITLLDILMEPP